MNGRSRIVFLSYAHADEEAATRVYQHLLGAGLEPWMDKFSLTPGAVWRDEIGRAIRRSGAFLSLLSVSSVDRAGVLRGEMKLALDLRAERLDDGGILIPVRLEPCELPQELHHLQYLDWFLPPGPGKLTEALAGLLEPASLIAGILGRLRRMAAGRWALSATAIICLGAAVGAYRIASRPVVPAPQIGLTLWRVTEENAAGSGACGFLRFSRQPLAKPVHTGDRLRLDVQASQEGYVYVISREIDKSGNRGTAQLLFPVSSVNGGKNRISPGSALFIPPASDVCNTLELKHAGAAEQVWVLWSEKKITALPVQDEPYSLDAGAAAMVEETGGASAVAMSPEVTMARGIALPDSETRELGYSASGPDSTFTATGKPRTMLGATFTLKTLP